MHRPSRKLLIIVTLLVFFAPAVIAQKRRPPPGGRLAVVVDERLAALRDSPALSGKLLHRLSRGRLVAIRHQRRSRDGILFCRVSLTTRTSGWIQREALTSPSQHGDDQKLLSLIKESKEFDRISRARIFLDIYPRSVLRPTVLLMYGDEAERVAERLSRDAVRRLDVEEMAGNTAPDFSYFLNYNGLDRYNRQGITFVFDRIQKEFHYSGAAWREVVRRYPRSVEAMEARKRLMTLHN
jgi:hypothetical protein